MEIAIAVDQLGCVAKDSFVRVLDSDIVKIYPNIRGKSWRLS